MSSATIRRRPSGPDGSLDIGLSSREKQIKDMKAKLDPIYTYLTEELKQELEALTGLTNIYSKTNMSHENNNIIKSRNTLTTNAINEIYKKFLNKINEFKAINRDSTNKRIFIINTDIETKYNEIQKSINTITRVFYVLGILVSEKEKDNKVNELYNILKSNNKIKNTDLGTGISEIKKFMIVFGILKKDHIYWYETNAEGNKNILRVNNTTNTIEILRSGTTKWQKFNEPERIEYINGLNVNNIFYCASKTGGARKSRRQRKQTCKTIRKQRK